MKRIIVLFIVLVSSIGQAQQSYEINLYDLTYRIRRGVKNKTSSQIHIEIVYSGGRETLYYRDIRNEGDQENRWRMDRPLVISKVPIRIDAYCFVNFRKGTDAGATIPANFSEPCVREGTFSGNYSPRMTPIDFKYSIKPIFRVPEPTYRIQGYDAPLELEANTGFANNLYRWQYATSFREIVIFPVSTPFRVYDWKDIPGNRINPKTVNLSNFLPESIIGEDVFFRVTGNCTNNFGSNIISYKITKSAPEILRVITTPPSCFDGTDGTITIQFDSGLDANDNLSVAVGDLSIPIGGMDENNRPNLQSVAVDGGNNIVLDADNRVTLTNVPPSTTSFRIDIYGSYKGEAYFTGGTGHSRTVKVARRSPVAFTTLPENGVTPVYCYDGDDGQVSFSAEGGVGRGYEYLIKEDTAAWSTNWQSFSSGASTTIPRLSKGTYQIKIRDGNECVAKIQKRDSDGNLVLGDEIIETFVIEAPELPLQVTFDEALTKDPTAFGFTNGVIVAKVTGGTPDAGAYTFEWRNNDNNLLTTTTTRVLTAPDVGFLITLNSVPEGTYYLTVWDKNYTAATFKTTCTVERLSRQLSEPNLLELSIEESQPISCNSANTNNNPASDGILIAHASGGVPLAPKDNLGLPYYYTWKKQNATTNAWETLAISDSIARDLNEGIYAVNIRDANGIVIGTYENNLLQREEDVLHDLIEPELLQITYIKQDVFCNGGTDGAIDLTIIGGTPFTTGASPYSIRWSNGASTEDISNLAPDIVYRVAVTDARGCTAFEAIEINAPEPIEFEFVDFQHPSGFEFTDGWIKATVEGGTVLSDGGYRYEWRDMDGRLLNDQVTTVTNAIDGVFELTLNNVGDGVYFLTLWDANFDAGTQKEGCMVMNQQFILREPEPLRVLIEESSPISCNNSNVYDNPSNDGVLVAHATGGVPLASATNNGLPYYYTWKKQQTDASWRILEDQRDSIASNLDVGSYAVNIEDRNGVILAVYERNLVIRETDSITELEQPTLLGVTFSKQDVYCHAGSDGWAIAQPQGGTPPYTIAWNTGAVTERIENLEAGNYEVLVTDDRGCEVLNTIEISEPSTPIRIDYPAYNRPSSIGANDAWIMAEVHGGTPLENQTYIYEWTDETGAVINEQVEASVTTAGVFTITLQSITAGKYYLTVRDKNHTIATTKSGCTVLQSEFVIHEPIEAVLDIDRPISCNAANEFLDPSSDGALVAHVVGGVPFETGLPYKYYWKKLQENGNWLLLPEQTDSIATGLDAGTYALNAEDQLGTVMGTYQSDILIQAVDSTLVFNAPDLLKVSLTAVPISCDQGNDGRASVAITGGIPPYDIEWSNGATSSEISNLIAGKYVVFVTDQRGCRATGRIEIEQPGGLIVSILTEKAPTCYDGDDGVIEIKVSGGTPPYDYTWNDGAKGVLRTQLQAGTYRFQITDHENCTAFTEITLQNPIPVSVDLGENRTICNNQSLDIDVTIDDSGATYLWQSDTGFSSTESAVSITETGVYSVSITTSLGCVGYDEVRVTTSDQEIDADFLLLSQAFTGNEVTMVNVSAPDGDQVEWIIPNVPTIQKIAEDAERLVVVFDAPGTYTFSLRTYQGDCYAEYQKNIIVEKAIELPDIGDARDPFIEEFVVFPNPTNGVFKAQITLSETAPIAFRMFNLTDNRVEMEAYEDGKSTYVIPVSMHAATGTYIVVLETPKGDAIRKIIFE